MRTRHLLLPLLLLSASARAQEAAPVLQPPRLTTFVEAQYPAEAQESHLQGSVELEILVDGDGSVGDVKVVGPAGHGFDEAAMAAARAFVFEPARRGDEVVPARIRYRYVFELKPPPVPEPPPSSPPPA